MAWRLSTFPSVTVRIVCESCGRAGRYRLARLAHRFGPEAELVDVVGAIIGRCGSRTPTSRGCCAKVLDPGDEGARRPPPVVPRSRRNPRRAYDRDGREIEPPTIATMLPPRGSGRVRARCQANGCGHTGEVDVTGWPAGLYVPDIGLHLRCRQCGLRGDAHIVPVAVDRGPSGTW